MKKQIILLVILLLVKIPVFSQSTEHILNRLAKEEKLSMSGNPFQIIELNQIQRQSNAGLPFIDSITKVDLWDTLGGIWAPDWSGKIYLNSEGRLASIVGFSDGYSDYKEELLYNTDGTLAEINEFEKDNVGSNWKASWIQKWKYDSNKNPIKEEEFAWNTDSNKFVKDELYLYYYSANELDSFVEWGNNWDYDVSQNMWKPYWVKQAKLQFFKTGNVIDSAFYWEADHSLDTLKNWYIESKYYINSDVSYNLLEFLAHEYVGDSMGIRLYKPVFKQTFNYNANNQCVKKIDWFYDFDSTKSFIPIYNFYCTYHKGNPIQYTDNNIEDGIEVWNRIINFSYDSNYSFNEVNAYYFSYLIDAQHNEVIPNSFLSGNDVIPDYTKLSFAPTGFNNDEENETDFKILIHYSDGIVKVFEPKNQKQSIYPNPSNGIIYCSGFTFGQSVQVFSIDGKLAFSGVIKSNQLNLSQLNKGLYILKIGDLYTEKIILD